MPFDSKAPLPQCVKAKGTCPPEDVGGIWGYYDLLQVLKDPKHSEHEEMKEWIGDEFDPDAYHIDEANERLARCR